jgi:hypothetical protein
VARSGVSHVHGKAFAGIKSVRSVI